MLNIILINSQVWSFRLKSPKTATLIFSSGKMVCTGAKSEEQAIKAVRSVVQKLRKGGIKIKKDAVIVIQNIVASASLGGRYTLNKPLGAYPEACMNRNNSQV